MYLCYITIQVFLNYKPPSTVDPPDAPMADKIVTNIRLAEPMTPAPDYRFYATFTWNPPVYPYKNITEYAFTWSKQPEHLYLNRGGGSPVSFFICLFVDNFKLNVKRYLNCFFFAWLRSVVVPENLLNCFSLSDARLGHSRSPAL